MCIRKFCSQGIFAIDAQFGSWATDVQFGSWATDEQFGSLATDVQFGSWATDEQLGLEKQMRIGCWGTDCDSLMKFFDKIYKEEQTLFVFESSPKIAVRCRTIEYIQTSNTISQKRKQKYVISISSTGFSVSTFSRSSKTFSWASSWLSFTFFAFSAFCQMQMIHTLSSFFALQITNQQISKQICFETVNSFTRILVPNPTKPNY